MSQYKASHVKCVKCHIDYSIERIPSADPFICHLCQQHKAKLRRAENIKNMYQHGNKEAGTGYKSKEYVNKLVTWIENK